MTRPALPAIACLVYASTCVGGAPPARAADGDCPYLRMHAAVGGLVAAVNTVVEPDIPIAAAMSVGCTEPKLPASRAALLDLLPEDHGRLIADCARGRAVVKRGVNGFDLLGLIDEPVEPSAEASAVRSFFHDRTVDVAIGRASSAGPYPISFDWAVVLDTRSATLYSFILNCGD